MPPGTRLAALVLFLLALAWAGGCGDSTGGRLPVSGSVTLKNKPLEEGVIEFVPVTNPPEGVPYTKSGAAIKGGSYSIPKKQGLVPGKYKVLITSGIKQEATGEEAPAPSGGKEAFIDHIPPEYNVNSKQVVEVTSEGPNEFNFAIP